MPVNEDNRNESGNTKGKPGKGNPSDYGQSKAGVDSVNGLENLEERQKLEEKHEGITDPGSDALKGSNPNRNLDKPDMDKPSYGGGH